MYCYSQPGPPLPPQRPPPTGPLSEHLTTIALPVVASVLPPLACEMATTSGQSTVGKSNIHE